MCVHVCVCVRACRHVSEGSVVELNTQSVHTSFSNSVNLSINIRQVQCVLNLVIKLKSLNLVYCKNLVTFRYPSKTEAVKQDY